MACMRDGNHQHRACGLINVTIRRRAQVHSQPVKGERNVLAIMRDRDPAILNHIEDGADSAHIRNAKVSELMRYPLPRKM